MKREYEAVIGLEVHVQLLTKTKAFCGCSTDFGAPPNTHVCPVCLGLPGALPVVNKEAVRLMLMLGLATHSNIRRISGFARKNYFYPDLPKGYQITQYEVPICEDGYITIGFGDKERKIEIERIHLEEDAGKSVHDPDTGMTYVDFNRCGVPLAEIVSRPQLHSPQEAVLYLKELHNLVTYLGISEGSMEQGKLRCDANVSVRPVGSTELGVRTEVKNINSFHFVAQALEYEINRQINILEEGGEVVFETRLFNARLGRTIPMRSKETSSDYRYFPEPDLLQLVISDELVKEAEDAMQESPGDRKRRFVRDYHIGEREAEALVASKSLADFYEETVKLSGDPKRSVGFVLTELLGLLNKDDRGIEDSPIKPGDLAELVKAVGQGKLNSKMAKEALAKAYKGKGRLSEIIKSMGSKISDEDQIRKWVMEVIEASPDEVRRYKAGKKGLLGYFVGQVMKLSKGKADPKVVNKLLRDVLEG